MKYEEEIKANAFVWTLLMEGRKLDHSINSSNAVDYVNSIIWKELLDERRDSTISSKSAQKHHSE